MPTRTVMSHINDELYKRSRAKAALHGISISALIRDALDETVPKDIRIVIGSESAPAGKAKPRVMKGVETCG